MATLCCLMFRDPRCGRVLLCFPSSSLCPLPRARPCPAPQAAVPAGHHLSLISQAVWASCPGSSRQSAGWQGQQNPCHGSLCSLQTLDAMDTMLKAVVLNSPAESLQDILEVWAVQSGGPGAIPYPEGFPTPGWMVPSPVVSRQSALWGGCPPALGLSWSTGLQRVAPAWPQGWSGPFVPGTGAS